MTLPFPPPPQVPNWQPGNGSRLVTERIDFEAHLEGVNPPYALNFRHTADQIDLQPLNTEHQPTGMIIDGYTVYNVQQALQLLANIVSPPDIQPATTASLGIVQLAGDIAGVATAVLVKGLQGRPINTNVPVSGQVLTWTGSAWGPVTPSNSVVFSGDLNGVIAGPQEVVGLTGTSGIVAVHATALLWDSNAGSVVGFAQTPTSSAGALMVMQAQSSSSGAGGSLQLTPGGGSTVNNSGVVALTDSNYDLILQVGNPGGRRVSALGLGSQLSTTIMPTGTGDLVTLFGNAGSAPTTGSPYGPIVYGTGGNLWVMQSNGLSFQVGSVPNPSGWGIAPAGFTGASFVGGGYTYTARATTTTSSSSPLNLFQFTVPTGTEVRVDCIIVGRNTSTNDAAQYNLSIGYTNTTGTTSAVGTVTSADPRFNGTGSSWTVPSINLATNTVTISSGAFSGATINWTASVQLVFGA